MRFFISLAFLFAITFNVYGQVPDYVPTEGLAAWYPLNGNATDLIGGNNGVLFGNSASDNRFGEPGGALGFDGDNDYVSLDTFFGGSQVVSASYSLWFNSHGSVNTQHISGKEGFWRTIAVRLNNDNSLSFGGTSSGVYFGLSTESNLFNLDEWNHLVITFGDSTIKIYLNGEMVASGASASPFLDFQFVAAGNSTATNYLGAIHPVSLGVTGYFNGELDDFGLWSRVLSVEEISNMFQPSIPNPGCTDSTACNFDDSANTDDGSCIPSGCMDTYACNFNSEAECEGEVCDYTCCPGPGCCDEGTYWNEDTQTCIITILTDTNLDGCTDLNDLMDILSAYGDCAVAEFNCGDLLEYQGYDYETVQIGDQCWFAENLRTEQYDNGDTIPGDLSDSQWVSMTAGAQAVYNGLSSNLNLFGRLYNLYSVLDDRGLCPTGWHVPADPEWLALAGSLGGEEVAGLAMKASIMDNPAWDGTNSSGFSGLQGGKREINGFFGGSSVGYWWTSTTMGCGGWHRNLHPGNDALTLSSYCNIIGFSVRCIKD